MKKETEKTYEYVGDGLGIPGLSHLETKESAKLKGALEILEAAIKNGSYKEIKSKPIKAKE